MLGSVFLSEVGVRGEGTLHPAQPTTARAFNHGLTTSAVDHHNIC